MEKLSIFDLLAFAIPGTAALMLFYWAGINLFDFRLAVLDIPDSLKLILLVLLAYFVGHLINDWSRKIETKLGKVPQSWADVLKEDSTLAIKLDEVSQKVFNAGILNPEGAVDVDKSDVFYDRAFAILEVEDKLEKVRTLQSQYVFFRNNVFLSLLGIVVFAIVLLVRSSQYGVFQDEAATFSLFGMIFCGIAMFLSRRLSFKRRKMKMKATLNNFYAFYVSETIIKK